MSIKSTATIVRKASTPDSPAVVHRSHPQSTPALLQLARTNPSALAPTQVLQLQRAVGNRAVAQLLAPKPSTAPVAPSVPSPVVQRTEKDAGNYSKRLKLGLKLSGGFPKYADVEAYVKDTSNLIEHRRGLLQAWNKSGIVDRDLKIMADQKNPIAIPDDLVPKGEKMESVDDLSGWDSEDEKDLDLSKIIADNAKSKVTIVRSSTNKEIPDRPVLPLSDMIRIGRQIVKRDQYELLPLVSQIGPIMVEYDNPGTKDIYATPLTKDGDTGRWKRAGASTDYNFANLTDHLEKEADAPATTVKDSDGKETKKEPPTKKRKLENIMDPFRGKSSDLTPNEAEAVGAISCDFMKGSGAMHFIEVAEKHKGEVVASFEPYFKQSPEEKEKRREDRKHLLYRPAEKEGRGLVTDHTDKKRKHRATVKPLVKKANSLVSTIARAKTKPDPTQWGLLRMSAQMNLEPSDMTKLLEPTDESVKAITEELEIKQDIIVHYPVKEKRKSQKFGGYGGEALPLYHLGGDEYSEVCPDVTMYEEIKETK
jgi:hypothetical protein